MAEMKFCPVLRGSWQCYKFLNYILRLHVKSFILPSQDPSFVLTRSCFAEMKFSHVIASAHLKPQTTTDQSYTSQRRLQTSHRRSQTSGKRVKNDYRRVTDESQTTTTNHSKSFFEYIYKTLFSESTWFSNAPMKRWFLLKKGKSRI